MASSPGQWTEDPSGLISMGPSFPGAPVGLCCFSTHVNGNRLSPLTLLAAKERDHGSLSWRKVELPTRAVDTSQRRKARCEMERK